MKSKTEIKGYLGEYSQSTSLHGVKYIGERRLHLIERFFWIIVLLIFFTLCGMEVAKVWDKWRSSPVIMSFAQRPTNVANVPYPSVTICTETRIKKSVIDVLKNKDKISKQLEGKLPYANEKEKLLIEAMSMQCFVKTPDKGNNFLFPANFTPTDEHIKTLIEVLTPSIEDVFNDCSIHDIVVDCSTIVRPVMTDYGICYIFNAIEQHEFFTNKMKTNNGLYTKEKVTNSTWSVVNGYTIPLSYNESSFSYPYRASIFVSRLMGVDLSLNAPDAKDIQNICSLGISVEDFRITLQNPAEFTDILYGNVFRAVVGIQTMISIKPRLVTTSASLKKLSPTIRQCYFQEEKNLTIFSTYTKINCEFECDMKLLYLYCDTPCVSFLQPAPKRGNLSYCSPNVLRGEGCGKNYDARYNHHFGKERYDSLATTGETVSCDCLSACTELSYEFNVGIMPLGSRGLTSPQNNARRAFISLFYDTDSFYATQRTELYGITDFVASAGGLFSLFSGFSLISLVEVCYFATLRLFFKVRRENKIKHKEIDITPLTPIQKTFVINSFSQLTFKKATNRLVV